LLHPAITPFAVMVILLALCGFTSQKTYRRGLELSGLVHEAHPSFPYACCLTSP